MRPALALLPLALTSACLNFSPDGQYACSAGDSKCLRGGETDGGADSGFEPVPDSGFVPPPETGLSRISGKSTLFRLNGNGEPGETFDNSSRTVAALVLDGGTWASIPGQGYADGTFVIDNAPPAVTWVRVGTNFFRTSSRNVDLSEWRMGRPNAAVATEPTPVTVNISNLSNFKGSDRLQFVSIGSGARFFGISPQPTGNVLNGGMLEFSQNRTPLVDSTKGDRVEVSQLVGESPDGGYVYSGLRRSYRAPANFNVVNGQPAQVDAALVELTALNTATLDIRRPEFDSHRALTSATPGTAFTQVALRALPGAATRGSYEAGPFLAYFFDNTSVSDFQMSMTYANPYDGTDAVGELFVGFPFSYALGAASPVTVNAGLQVDDSVAGLTKGPIRPAISPVRSLLLNGVNAFANQSNVGESPTLSWEAPAVGTPTLYIVGIRELGSANGVTTFTTAMTLYTADRSISLPPGILQQGKQYFISLTAILDPARSVTRPFALGHPAHRAGVLSGTFSP